jgi:hypothetical protein
MWPIVAQRLGELAVLGRKDLWHRNGMKNVQGKPEETVLSQQTEQHSGEFEGQMK